MIWTLFTIICIVIALPIAIFAVVALLGLAFKGRYIICIILAGLLWGSVAVMNANHKEEEARAVHVACIQAAKDSATEYYNSSHNQTGAISLAQRLSASCK